MTVESRLDEQVPEMEADMFTNTPSNVIDGTLEVTPEEVEQQTMTEAQGSLALNTETTDPIEEAVKVSGYTQEELLGYDVKQLKEIAVNELGMVEDVDFKKQTKQAGMIKAILSKQGNHFKAEVEKDKTLKATVTDIKTKQEIVPPELCEKFKENQFEAVAQSEFEKYIDTKGIPLHMVRSSVTSNKESRYYLETVNQRLINLGVTFEDIAKACLFSPATWDKKGKLTKPSEIRIDINICDIVSIYKTFIGCQEFKIKKFETKDDFYKVTIEKNGITSEEKLTREEGSTGLSILLKGLEIELTDRHMKRLNERVTQYNQRKLF